MDPVTVGFYATVCGALSVAGPRLGTFLPRLLIGACVGIVAAMLLPVIRQGLGFY